MLRRILPSRAVLAPFVLALALTGCGDSVSNDKAVADTSAEPLKVGVVFDSGGRGDKSFNDSAWAGIQKAKAEFGIEELSVDSRSAKDFEPNLRAMAEQGVKLVFAVGLMQREALAKVAPEFPETKFVLIDEEVDAPNVRSVKFKEEEGSFLAGYAAALASESGKIGFVGGMELPLIKKFEVGYSAGAKTARPDIVVLPAKYTGSWDDSGQGKVAASVLFKGGADVVYHAAGRAGLGVIAAAKDAGKYAIGVDSDQDYVAEGRVLTSMIKRVDEAVYSTIKDVLDGSFSAGLKIYDLKGGGVGLSPMTYTKDAFGAENLAKVEEMREKIMSGEILVPTTEAELEHYLEG